MSEQWHYEQKGESYIKVDTLHKIITLKSELAAARKRIAKLKEQYTPWWARERSEIDKLREVTEQRDEYKAALQSADNHNHEIATKLEIVTEQRDRLAEALRKAISWGDSASHHILYRQNINWTYLNEAREALQSLTTNV